MNKIEYKSFLKKRKMAVNELLEYYQQLRLYESTNSINNIDIKSQKRILFLIRFITKINRLLEHRSLRVLNNQSYYTSEAKVYVCTKSPYATESLTETIPGHFNITLEEENELSLIEHLLLANGNLRIQSTKDNKDNFIIKNMQENNLLNRGTEVVFPEKSKSTSLVGTLSDDASSLIIKTGAIIIPVAVEDYEMHKKTLSVINIGKNLCVGTDKPEHIKDITKIIKIDLEHLKQEIHESYGDAKVLRKRL